MVGVETVAGSPDSRVSQVRDVLRSADRYRVAMWAIVGAQAIWLGALMSRGWYYQADFSNLAQASGRDLSWSYLTLPQGGHLGVPGRLIFWVLNHAAPLNYAITILLRVVAQAAATVLLSRLLASLVGRRPGVLVIVGLYAFSPLLVPGTLWLTSSIGLLLSQLLLLFALTSHLRYVSTRQLKWAFGAAGGVFGATLCAEQAAVTALVLPVLSLGFLHSGTLRERLRDSWACWREWLLIGAPLIAYVAYYFAAGSYTATAHGVSLADAWKVIGLEWSASIAPALMGGPFSWLSNQDNYYAFADPGWIVRSATIIAFVGLVVVGMQRTGPRAVLAWSMPALASAVGIVVVAIGRFNAFGTIIAQRLEYSYYVAILAAIAACLSLWDVRPEVPGERDTTDGPTNGTSGQLPRTGVPRQRLTIAVVVGVVAVIGAGSIASAVSYTQQWARNPARGYVNNLEASLRRAGPTVNLYDTPLNPTIVSTLEPARYVSDLVTLTGLPARFDYGGPSPRIVAPSGRIVSATFLPASHVEVSGSNAFCSNLVSHIKDLTERLSNQAHRNAWFLQISFFQQHGSVLYVSLIDDGGQEISPVTGSRVVLNSRLGTVYLRFPSIAPVALRVRSTSPATNICLTQAQVGYPFPAQAQS